MGSVVAVACASHSPGITGFPDKAESRHASAVLGALDTLKGWLSDLHLDAVVVISAEHFTNFSLANLPTFAVGVAAGYDMPATDAFASFLGLDRRVYPGAADLGDAVHAGLLRAGFDPALVAGDYGFDEGFAVPLARMFPDSPVPVVPIVVNAVHKPFPSLSRCAGLGRALRSVLEDPQVPGRVAVIGTGGLSHWVGLPRAGEIDEAFDRRFVALMEAGDVDGMCEIDESTLDEAGNGTHEVRAWIAAAATSGGAPFEVLAYEAVPAWLTGTCIARSSPAGSTPGGANSKPQHVRIEP